jgi:hypothetical protein
MLNLKKFSTQKMKKAVIGSGLKMIQSKESHTYVVELPLISK